MHVVGHSNEHHFVLLTPLPEYADRVCCSKNSNFCSLSDSPHASDGKGESDACGMYGSAQPAWEYSMLCEGLLESLPERE